MAMILTAENLVKHGLPLIVENLTVLLRAAWLVSSLLIICACIPFSPFTSIRKSVGGFARRGKLLNASTSSKPKWAVVPQSYFLHFYVVGAIWTSFLLAYVLFLACGLHSSGSLGFSSIASYLAGGVDSFSFGRGSSEMFRKYGQHIWKSAVVLLLFEIHVLRRLYESLYVFNYSPSARMHILGYLTGLFFYVAAPLSMCTPCAPEVFSFAISQAYNSALRKQSHILDMEVKFLELAEILFKLGWMQWTGTLLFFWGWTHQYRCHKILGSLRSEQLGGGNEYSIPNGDWFEIVSCPHYLAEIVIYIGLVIASGGSDITMWLLLLFVITNLTFTACDAHKWYLRKFDNYPCTRRAIIPFTC